MAWYFCNILVMARHWWEVQFGPMQSAQSIFPLCRPLLSDPHDGSWTKRNDSALSLQRSRSTCYGAQRRADDGLVRSMPALGTKLAVIYSTGSLCEANICHDDDGAAELLA